MQTRDQLLIVDDEPDACWALERILERKYGARCRRAATAAAAIAELRRGSFAIALLDAKLPDMDGLDLARIVRSFDAAIPMIIVSGYFYRDDRAIQTAEAAGVIHGFVGKPFQHQEVLRAVAAALAWREKGGTVDSRN
jgi:DNA-binding NtrC family response regulator